MSVCIFNILVKTTTDSVWDTRNVIKETTTTRHRIYADFGFLKAPTNRWSKDNSYPHPTKYYPSQLVPAGERYQKTPLNVIGFTWISGF